MDPTLRDAVRARAGNLCEYCGLPQEAEPDAKFHIEHIVARQHGGSDDPSNLALACWRCNLHKGPNLTAIDPSGGEVTALFHPRRDAWQAHFVQQVGHIIGMTRVGRATVQLLNMNAPRRVELRLALLSEKPPPTS
jgi:hypothetical protein